MKNFISLTNKNPTEVPVERYILIKQSTKDQIICLWCNQPTNIIWVHGHGQRAIFGINKDECCCDENCNVSKEKENYNKENAN